MNRRNFSKLFSLGLCATALLGVSQCHRQEEGASSLQSLRNILNAVEATFKLVLTMGLASDLIHIVANYLTLVAKFVNEVGEVLENAALSAAEQAAKILSLGAGVVMPHVTDQRVATALQTVQSAVEIFLNLYRNVRPPTVTLTDNNRRTIEKIEKDATKDSNDVERWAAGAH